jgi:hypothetical protein
VYVMCIARSGPVALHLRVELLQVLRLKSVEAVRADTRDEVFLDVSEVAGMGVVTDVRRHGDVFDPMREPCRDRPTLPGLRDLAGISFPVQAADLPRYPRFGLRLDVTAVRTSVVLHANGDTPMPLAVLTETMLDA